MTRARARKALLSRVAPGDREEAAYLLGERLGVMLDSDRPASDGEVVTACALVAASLGIPWATRTTVETKLEARD